MCPSGDVYLEAGSDSFCNARDFLIAAATPVSRMAHFHHYRLTTYSLFAASSMNLDGALIMRNLERLSKVELPSEVRKFVEVCTRTYGKTRLVLRRNRVFVESQFPDILKQLPV